MKVKNLFESVLLIALLLSCKSNQLFDADATFLTNISVIDPLDGLKENQTVMIKDGRIEQIAPSSAFNLSSKNKIIDGTGKFVIPGLWDSHVHLAYMEELAPKMFDLFLAYGITSIRDTGGRKDFVFTYRTQSRNNPELTPRVMMAGPLLDGVPNVYDGADEGHPPLSVRLANVEDVKNEVMQLDSLKVDFLKAYEMLSPEQFMALMQLAKERDLRVTGHVPLSMDVISASNAGLSSMEHFRNLELSCASNSEELLAQRKDMLTKGITRQGGELRTDIHTAQREVAIKNFDREKAANVLKVLKANDTWQIPTLALNTFSTEKFFRSEWWKESVDLLPATIRQSWEADAQKVDAQEVTDFRKLYSQWMFDMVKMVHESGITIMAGTDSPIALQPPGVSLHNELAMYVKAGLEPLEVIKSATITPARYFKMEGELGRMKEGYLADLLIVNKNPLENIENTRNIFMVIKQGRAYTQEELLQKVRSNP